MIRPSLFTSSLLSATPSPTSHPRLASMATRPCVISLSLQRRTSWMLVALDRKFRGSKMLGNGSLMPGRVFASASDHQPHKRNQLLPALSDTQARQVQSDKHNKKHVTQESRGLPALRARHPHTGCVTIAHQGNWATTASRRHHKWEHSHARISSGVTVLSGAVCGGCALTVTLLLPFTGLACDLKQAVGLATKSACLVIMLAAMFASWLFCGFCCAHSFS